MSQDVRIRLKPSDIEKDIEIVLPGGKETILLQWRNYEGERHNRHGATLDVILPHPTVACNWMGSEMKPARLVDRKHPEQHLVDQVALML